MDLLLGGFADRYVAAMTATELDRLEQLIELPDPSLYRIYRREEEAPAALRGPLLDLYLSFKI
jgi:succinate dehydrogenase flavin-adding protein (antitoxin of CptAB toxin-antitoxin module)